MKRHTKQQCKYALAVSKYIKQDDFQLMGDQDIEKYNKFAGVENKWRDGIASKSPIVNERWGLFE